MGGEDGFASHSYFNFETMTFEYFRDFCLSLPEAEEAMPFDDEILVYKISGKIFACTNIRDFHRVAVKCEPNVAIELRDKYSDIRPAWHFNQRHWNDVYLNGDLPREVIQEQILNSYQLVASKTVTPKAERERLAKVIQEFMSSYK